MRSMANDLFDKLLLGVAVLMTIIGIGSLAELIWETALRVARWILEMR